MVVQEQSFNQYQSIIDQFKGKVGRADFEREFNKATAKLSTKDRFLLKMELKRLAAPCTRLIDLRGHVDGVCEPFEYEGKTHFIDAVAKRVFEQEVNLYGGYTIGVYEALQNTENNFRVRYQKQKQQALAEKTKEGTNSVKAKEKPTEKTQYYAQFYSTQGYFDRCEERMNYAVEIELELAPDNWVKAITSDISPSGLKVRFTKIQAIHLDQQVQVRLTGLEKEFQFGRNNTFCYQVKNILVLDNVQIVGFQRVEFEPEHDSFYRFLAGYIQGNKRRYKINLDNTINALQARVYEQFALPKINELPVFLEQSADNNLLPRYALTTANNYHIFNYWHNHQKRSTLSYLLNDERLNQLAKRKVLNKSLLVYCFTHQSNGKKFFYTADEEQLKTDISFRKQFLGFAAARESFRIFKLELLYVSGEFGYSPLTLANTLAKQDDYLNAKPSEQVVELINKLQQLVTVTDITHETLIAEYAAFDHKNINTAKLKALGHKDNNLSQVDSVRINYNNQRAEPRFIYSTQVIVETKGVNWQGKSKDFSISGLQVKLEKPAVLVKGDVVKISFPQLQKITTSFDLNKLPYQVVHVSQDKTVINLTVQVQQHQHVGRTFFKMLIDKNRDKLKADEYAMMIPGLAKALRNMYAHEMTQLNLLVQTSGSRYKTEVILSGSQQSELFAEMARLSDRDGYYNLYPILAGQNNSIVNDTKLKKLLATDQSITEILYISINPSKTSVIDSVNIKTSSELASPQLKKMFIKRAIKHGYFYAVQLKLARTNEPVMEYLTPELSYIGTYAIHRAKQIEQSIWSVAGVIQCIDMTSEAMIRYQLH